MTCTIVDEGKLPLLEDQPRATSLKVAPTGLHTFDPGIDWKKRFPEAKPKPENKKTSATVAGGKQAPAKRARTKDSGGGGGGGGISVPQHAHRTQPGVEEPLMTSKQLQVWRPYSLLHS